MTSPDAPKCRAFFLVGFGRGFPRRIPSRLPLVNWTPAFSRDEARNFELR